MTEKDEWLRYVFGLTFLHSNEVRDAFLEDLGPIKPRCLKLDKFSEYLLSQYILNDATYPPSLWACHTASLQQTTNACESFHSRFNDCFYKAHPDIFTFTERLTEFQTDSYVQIQGLHRPKIYRNEYTRCQTHVQNFIQQYDRREITRVHFVIRCGYYMCPKAKKSTPAIPASA